MLISAGLQSFRDYSPVFYFAPISISLAFSTSYSIETFRALVRKLNSASHICCWLFSMWEIISFVIFSLSINWIFLAKSSWGISMLFTHLYLFTILDTKEIII